jgi:hypothetical protein
MVTLVYAGAAVVTLGNFGPEAIAVGTRTTLTAAAIRVAPKIRGKDFTRFPLVIPVHTHRKRKGIAMFL